MVFTSGGTESDNLAIKGLFWSRRSEDPRRVRILSTPIEHHAVLDPLDWLGTEGAKVELIAVDRQGRLDVDAFRAAVESDPESVALVTVMWANNEVGTVQPIAEVVEIAHAHGIPVHTDAVQALGQLPLDFAGSGVDAMTVTGHKIGGPYGVGALVVRRELQPTALLHGGGQERDIRSGTIDPPAIAGFAVACELAVERQPELAARLVTLRDRLVDGVRREVPDAIYNGDAADGPDHRLPGNAHLEFPGCEGDSLLMLLDARGIECSTGSACDAGIPQASHVLLAMGSSEEFARSSLRFSLGHTSTEADVDALVEAIGPVVERARNAALVDQGQRETLMRVLAAMSGGVDSAVAAARAAEQGHDVTGIHLALSRNPKSYRTGARGCCTIEDANDARRAADVIGIPFYVWDLSERFHEDVVEDFLERVRRGPHAEPVPALQREDQVRGRARPGDRARLRRGRHRSLRAAASRRRRADRDAPRGGHGQGPELRARRTHPGAARALDVPARRQPEVRRTRGGGAARPRRRDKPDSHDICFISDGDTGGWLSEKLLDDSGVNRDGQIVSSDGEVLGSHEGSWRYTIGQRRGLRIGTPAADGKPRYVLDIEPVSGTVTVGPRDELAVDGLSAIRPRWCGAAPTGALDVHGPAARARRRAPRRGVASTATR